MLFSFHSLLNRQGSQGSQQGEKKHGEKKKKGNKRGRAPNLAEGILLSLSYLLGVSFLIVTQVRSSDEFQSFFINTL